MGLVESRLGEEEGLQTRGRGREERRWSGKREDGGETPPLSGELGEEKWRGLKFLRLE